MKERKKRERDKGREGDPLMCVEGGEVRQEGEGGGGDGRGGRRYHRRRW